MLYYVIRLAQKFIPFFIRSYGKKSSELFGQPNILRETYNSEENPKYCWEEILKHLNKGIGIFHSWIRTL